MSPLNLIVAISVSQPPDDELAMRGLVGEHIDHAFVETARQVLAGAGALAYGGDLRRGGFTETLKALLRTYPLVDRPSKSRIRQYLARPVWSPMTTTERADVGKYFTVVEVDGDEPDDGSQITRARDYTAMRERMTAETDARIVIGGRSTAAEGRWPGVVEEAFLSIRSFQPIFICGGLGGAGALVARALRGTWPDELTDAHQGASSDHARALAEVRLPPSEQELRETLLDADPRNGLASGENELLMETTDLDLIIALVLRGLNAVDKATR